jgi:predicted ferric reductase
MISYSNDTLVFCAKNLGKNSWSNRLFNIVNNNVNILTNRKIYIQGPYGHLSVNYKNEKYKNIIIIAGGIGITPMISILEDINNSYTNNELSHVKKVYFYWIITHMSLYDAFKKYFTNLNKDIFEFKVYTTKKTSITNIFSSDNLATTFINEKPNVTYILNKIFSKESKNSVVLTCGPKKLTDEVSGICNNFEVDISNELF